MNLETLLKKQAELQDAMGNPMERSGTSDGTIKENILALIVEATEVLGEINWKPWKPQLKIVDQDLLAEELIDILQFWANAVNAAGIKGELLEKLYNQKLSKCYDRVTDGSTGRAHG